MTRAAQRPRAASGPHDSLQVPLRQPRRLAISGCASEISTTQNAIQPSNRPGMMPRAIIVMVFRPQVGWTGSAADRHLAHVLVAPQRPKPRSGDALEVGAKPMPRQWKTGPEAICHGRRSEANYDLTRTSYRASLDRDIG